MPDISERLGLKLPLGNEVFTRERYRENLEILDDVAAKKEDLGEHVTEEGIHVATEDREKWNAAGENLGKHAGNTTIHVTAEEKEAWSNAKVDSLPADKVTAGTLAGKVKAHPAAMAGSEAQLRDVVLVTTDPGAGAATGYPDGTVILVYE